MTGVTPQEALPEEKTSVRLPPGKACSDFSSPVHNSQAFLLICIESITNPTHFMQPIVIT
jgi:hypothetical protein